MNKDQFIYWLKGFAKAVNEEGPTPRQWEIIASELGKIKDCPDYSSPIPDSKIVRGWENSWEEPSKEIFGADGSIRTDSIVIDGFIQNQSITRANPPYTLTTTTNKDVAYTLKDKE